MLLLLLLLYAVIMPSAFLKEACGSSILKLERLVQVADDSHRLIVFRSAGLTEGVTQLPEKPRPATL
jgi:hypothetical protein